MNTAETSQGKLTLTVPQVIMIRVALHSSREQIQNLYTIIYGGSELAQLYPERFWQRYKMMAADALAKVEAEINSYQQLFEGAVVAVQAGTFNPQHTEPWMPGHFLGFSQPQAPITFQCDQLRDVFKRATAWFQAEKIMLAPFVEKFSALQPSSDLSFLKEFTDAFKQQHAATMPGMRAIIDDFETMCGIKRNG